MPFPTAHVIDPRWSTHHQGVAVRAMNATCTIGVPTGPAVYDPATDDTAQSYGVDYVGPCRVQPSLGAAGASNVAGQDLTGRSYLVQLAAQGQTADIAPGARCRILTAANDAQLVGQDLWVLDEQLASERFTRDLVCSDNQSDAKAAS